MSKAVMLKRAFHQAVATGAVRFTDVETDFLVIQRFMLDYAKKNGVEISTAEVDSFIKEQQGKLRSLSTKITGDGVHVEVEQISENYKPFEITKEDLLKDAFDYAAANAAVNFVDKVADFLVIRNTMLDYAHSHGDAFTLQEIESYIRQQEKMWDASVTDVYVTGNHINSLHVPDAYSQKTMTKEEVLKEGFARAASNPAIAYYDKNLDFTIIKNGMITFAKECGMDISEQEIVDYMKQAFHDMNEAVKDFSY